MAPYYQRIDVLINAGAGKQNATAVESVTEAFRASAVDARITLTEGAAIEREAAEAVRRGSSLIVVAGGDGSVSAAASAVAGTDAALGVIPLGTLNHFAKDLGIPLDAAEAARAIAAGRTAQIDIGEVNGRTFVNNVSVGMYARLVAERAAMQRIGRGKWIAHGMAALRVFRRYRRLRAVLDIDSERRAMRTPFVFVGNNEYQLSGFELGGRKVLDAGRLHVCMAPGMTRGGVARLILVAVFADVCGLDGFEARPAECVTLDAGVARLEASVDGEIVPFDNPLTFGIRRRALRVVVP